MTTNNQLIIFDTTLRDGEQSPGAAMTKEEKIKNSIIEEFGIEKWDRMIEHLNDPKKIKSTFHAIIPNFLDKALKAKS